MPLQRSESSSCRPLHRGFSPQWTFPMGAPFTASRDSCPGADAKFLAGFMAKNFVAGASHPGQMEREGVTSAPRKVHSGKQAAGVVAGGKTAAPSGAVSSHTVRCAGQRRRRGPPAFQAGVSLQGFSGGLAGHTPAGAGESITDGTHDRQ
ncbi:Uncharacterised protein [Shigella sonnei]|nr:Uncharacterised protein [Shigella sonnei]